ncbi:hypothetical protein EKN06_06495 [Croceicoccus ponticola]|uniref:Methyltransferase FkbM domain-containing protein n=1 Tax=Croceicoccus ponticola TaxID=2217664 RepID=A0A437GY35_9SPHN|nr:FkbM family methyltransferase [Croceicoccus ponticola]RVQ67592.1 hypothetical protein EKN06_06495 [Croceicoccus ponticola]
MADLRSIVRNFAIDRGYYVSRSTPADDVRRLLARLAPVTTSVPLIRMGGAADGGYLVPDDFDGIVACFSPGVDQISEFEGAVAARGIPCFLADASVDGPAENNPLFDFEKKFLGAVDGGQTVRLDTWVNDKMPGPGDLLLQIDIEGHEWPVLLSTPVDVLARFRVIVLEIHGLPDAFNPTAFVALDSAIQLLGSLFHVVHAHPNNALPAVNLAGMDIPSFVEVTLLRKDRADVLGMAAGFPHPLDATNVASLPDYVLPASMQASAARATGGSDRI